MSLRVHCDQCDAFMYMTATGQNLLQTLPFSVAQIEGRVFCSNDCRNKFIRWYFLGEPHGPEDKAT